MPSMVMIVVIPNIYKVRDEMNINNIVLEKNLIAEIAKYNKEVIYTQNFEQTIEWLRKNAKSNDLVLVMGAGDVFRITEELLN